MGNDEKATGPMRSVMGNDGADEIGFGWIGLQWLCDLSGGVRYMAAPVLGCDRWIGNFLFFLSLYLSLCTSDPEMVRSENFHFKPSPGQSLILHDQLKIFSGKFIFHAQPNTRIYRKAFSGVI